MDGQGVFRPPPPDYFCEHPDHRWEAEKLDMDLDDVFTTLPRRFNLMVIPILDRDAFRLETSHVASIANDRIEFYDLLEQRLEARRKELLDMMGRTFENLACDPTQMEETSHWGHAMHIYRSKSLDAFVRYFAGLLRSPRPSSDIAVSASNIHHDEFLKPRSEASSTSSSNAFDGVGCLSAEVPSGAHPSLSTTRESQIPSTANATTTSRKRTRSSTTPADDDEDGARPSKKARFYGPGGSPPPTSPRRPSSRHARRARGSQLPVPQPPSPSKMPPTTTVTPTASPAVLGPQPAAREANGNESSEQRGSVSSSQAANVLQQRVDSCLAAPDIIKKEADVEDATSTDARQGVGQHDPPAKRRRARAHTRLPLSASPRARPSRNATEPASRRIPGPTGRISRGSIDQTRPLPRSSRRTRPGRQAFYELDYKSKARPVMAETPRKAGGTCQVKTRQARMVD